MYLGGFFISVNILEATKYLSSVEMAEGTVGLVQEGAN